jgi:hypothetical protein
MPSRTDDTALQGWRERRRLAAEEHRRLARQDLVGVRLAELHHIRALLEETVVLVNVGWVQNAWFTVLDTDGRSHALSAHDIHRAVDSPVSGVCLVGGIVYAGGGPLAAHSQLVQRTLDVTWHALHEGPQQPVRWCPSPAVRAAHVRDLTRWNDHPHRTRGQVSGLLETTIRTTDRELELRRAQQVAVS